MKVKRQEPPNEIRPEPEPERDSRPNPVVQFIRLARPHFLLGAVLLYALGLGIAHYLGIPLDWDRALLGQAWVTLLQISIQFLNEYYNAPEDQSNRNRTPFSGGSGMLGPGKLPRRTALQAALACLAGLASLTVVMIAQGGIGPLVFLIMVIAFLGGFFYSTPPIALERSGYGELITSILLAYLVPAFAFSLQAGDLHRFISVSAFPLALLHLAMLLTFELPDYANDLKYGKRTLLVRLGWQAGMQLHNLLILGAYLVLGLATLLDLPTFVSLPAFLTLPVGLLQIWQMRAIADGRPPNWTALTLNGVATFIAMAYMITFAYWTH